VSIPNGWNRDEWLVHSDPGFGRTLSISTVPALKPSELLPTCKCLELFSEQYFPLDAQNRQDNSIYQSKSHLILARAFFTFHTDRSGKKWMTFYQTSTKLPNVHPITFNSVKKWFDSLNLSASPYSYIGVRVVSVVDWGESTVHGVKVTHDTVPYTLATMEKDESMVKVASRMDTYIVRAGIYSSTVEQAVSGMGKARLTALELLGAFAGNGKAKR
jgi:hypothetical protein